LRRKNKVESKEKYRIVVSNIFEALEDLDAEVKINSVWERIGENINISALESPDCEFRMHKLWFDEEC
jgi:hypothetical protein